MALLLKDASVRVSEASRDLLDPHIMFALGAALQAYASCSRDCIVTSARDGNHNPGSLHSRGLAVDLRTIQLTQQERTRIFNPLTATLSPLGFDVVWESSAGATPAPTAAHIHIEYDPKDRVFWRIAGAPFHTPTLRST